MACFTRATPGASLLTAWSPPRASTSTGVPARRTALIIGATALAAARAFACLEGGYDVVIAHTLADEVDEELQWREKAGELAITMSDGGELGSWLDSRPALLEDIALVFIVDTLRVANSAARSALSAAELRQACYERRLPVNIADLPSLSDFAVPSSQRIPLLDGTPSPLQIALTTNASACRLASRLRRLLVAALPKGAGSAVKRVAELRELIRAADLSEESCEEAWSALDPINAPVEQIPVQRSRCTSPRRGRSRPPLISLASAPARTSLTEPLDTPPATPPASSLGSFSEAMAAPLPRMTRMRFIAQISEYWPVDQLAKLDEKDAKRLFDYAPHAASLVPSPSPVSVPVRDDSADARAPPALPSAKAEREDASPNRVVSRHGLDIAKPAQPRGRGRIYLVGSGPGSPSLLTLAAHSILTRHATLILSDKLVPSPVLALIPPHIRVVIAQKFPGNAEGAQDELMRLGLEALEAGEVVVRLKQGDPLLYGRGGEEILFFRRHGYEAIVLPGVTSALAAPLLAGIPVTQRGVADSLVLATGVGRAGGAASLPPYDRPRTLVLLMSLARLPQLVENLYARGYPAHLPCAIIERASSPDQRAIASTLEGIAPALARMEQRPPGLLVVGWAVLALHGEGDMTVLDAEGEAQDEKRVQRWLAGRSAIVVEGLPEGWNELVEGQNVVDG